MRITNEIKVRVDEVCEVADRIKRFRFVRYDGGELPSFSGGAHITVNMDDDGSWHRNQYSLISTPGRTDAYEISVLHADDSRGGSEFMHARVVPGDTMWIGQPNNQFPAHDLARKHILVAGGIGITPFVAMMAQLSHLGHDFELHYAMLAEGAGSYVKELHETYEDRVRIYRSDLGERITLPELLAGQPLGTHVYVCGPERLIDAVLEAARLAGWPEDSVHWEKFLAPPAGDPFEVSLARSGISVRVGEHESILEALEAADVDAPYLCRGGVCGQCETRVLECDGTLQHNDEYLTAEERERGEQLMICMSRFQGRALTLDL